MAARTKLPKRPAGMPKRPKAKRPPMQLWDALDVVAVVRRLAATSADGMPTRAEILAALGNGRSAGTSLDTLVREGLVWRPSHGHYLPADMPSPDGEAALALGLQALQQAQRVADKTAFFLSEDGNPGHVVEFGNTDDVFNTPIDSRTNDYVNGHFG